MNNQNSENMLELYRKVKYLFVHRDQNHEDNPKICTNLIKLVVNDDFASDLEHLEKADRDNLYSHLADKIEEYIHTTTTSSIHMLKAAFVMSTKSQIAYLNMMAKKRKEAGSQRKSMEKSRSSDTRKSVSGPSKESSSSSKTAKSTDLKVDVLKIKAESNMFYNMRFYVVNEETVRFIKPSEKEKELSAYLQQSVLKTLKFEHIINWPNVLVTFKLPFIECTRSCNWNMSNYITADPRKLDVVKNDRDSLFFHTSTTNKSTVFHVPLMCSYLTLIEKCLPIAKISDWVRSQIKYFIFNIIQDVSRLDVAYCGLKYSYYTSESNYYRIFHKTDLPNPADFRTAQNWPMVETMNPEVQLMFKQSQFSSMMSDQDETELLHSFCLLLNNGPDSEKPMKELSEHLKKAISYQCTHCWESFTGALAFRTMCDHLVKHFSDKKWTCPKCEKDFSQAELAIQQGVHHCAKA